MKFYRNLFGLVAEPENLFSAWDLFRRGKTNRPDVMKFESRLEENIFKLHRELTGKTYRHGPYRYFWIRDPKLRRIHKAMIRDRVVHHAVFRILNLVYELTFAPVSFSCRIGKGMHRGVEKAGKMLRQVSHNYANTCYALKCDVKKFFDSVDHDTLIEILSRKIRDPDFMWLLKEIIGGYPTRGAFSSLAHTQNAARVGIPIGNLTSQLFANIYLNEFDQFVRHELKVKYYARYTDDFIIISKDRNYLQSLIGPVQEFLRERLKLALHPNKVTIRKFRQGIDFLGYTILPYHRALRTKTKKRIFRKIKQKINLHKLDLVSKDSLEQSLQSYLGVLSHADAYQISQEFKNCYWMGLGK